MNGLLLVDKPVGMSSFDVIRALRRLTGFRKIGHAGTLDPAASGLMLMLFGKACKQAASFNKLDKAYEAEITLGRTSTTGDREGELVAVSDRVPTVGEIEAVARGLVGEITQTPSVYSAIKIDGQEAYKRARRGETVVMPSRQVTVYKLVVLDYQYPVVRLVAEVSSGTYIRSLAVDMGEVLGTGAYLSGLRRTRVGDYGIEQALELAGASAEAVAAGLI